MANRFQEVHNWHAAPGDLRAQLRHPLLVDYCALPHSSGDGLSTCVAEDVIFHDGIIFLEAGDNWPQRGVAVADKVFEPIILCLARIVRPRLTLYRGVINCVN